MTAAALYRAMIAITANAVTAIIVAAAALIAGFAMQQFAWAVHTNAPHAANLSVRAVLLNAEIAKR